MKLLYDQSRENPESLDPKNMANYAFTKHEGLKTNISNTTGIIDIEIKAKW